MRSRPVGAVGDANKTSGAWRSAGVRFSQVLFVGLAFLSPLVLTIDADEQRMTALPPAAVAAAPPGVTASSASAAAPEDLGAVPESLREMTRRAFAGTTAA